MSEGQRVTKPDKPGWWAVWYGAEGFFKTVLVLEPETANIVSHNGCIYLGAGTTPSWPHGFKQPEPTAKDSFGTPLKVGDIVTHISQSAGLLYEVKRIAFNVDIYMTGDAHPVNASYHNKVSSITAKQLVDTLTEETIDLSTRDRKLLGERILEKVLTRA